MLELQNISRIYEIGKPKDSDYQQVCALDGVSVQFRKSEFVSILGPSGCGKTTMLNIIGGLDKYTSGDLIINQISTKEYKDSDWDNYRNNRIGFVFQSYNLIEHLTVLENVELALTLSGVKKAERKQKAKQALVKVGLEDKISSKPNQLSGGQMQRVAIARALVNNPEIILADEPTGALDTQTSLQVMELLKEVANERLVIMVTHNPEIANKYSTRIIKMLDGKLIDDSNPITEEEQKLIIETAKKHQAEVYIQKKKERELSKKAKRIYLKQQKLQEKKRKRKMSFFTALSLSFKNLLTKKARTFLVSMAGSIGIIGIALILSLSSGFQMYIDTVQKDTLSTYPITIHATSTDYSSLLESLSGTASEIEYDSSKVYSDNKLSDMINVLSNGTTTNDLVSFKKYLETNKVKDKLKNIATIKYTYNLQPNIFYNNAVNIPQGQSLLVSPFSMMTSMSTNSTAMSLMSETFEEMLDNPALIQNQYNLVAGSWANSQVYQQDNKQIAEVLVVLDKNNRIPDYALMALGLRNRAEIASIISGTPVEDTFELKVEDLLNLEYSLVLNPDMYQDSDADGIYNVITTNSSVNPYYTTDTVSTVVIDQLTSVTLKVVGVIKPNEAATATSISGTIAYTKSLTDYVISQLESYANGTIANNALYAQLNNAETNVLTGETFTDGEISRQKVLKTLGNCSLDTPASISFYASDFDAKADIEKLIQEYNDMVLADESLGVLEEREKHVISYTDYVGLMMDGISIIINAITYVLIAFVSISLVVSSIMIGIIIYISVLERTKEIGVLRSVGASKKDIKRVFTAESLIIGLIAGLLGIGVTIILNIPINLILEALAGVSGVAKLPALGATVLVLISMSLTFIAGLIPAKIASKKDPVVALRSE